MIYQQKLLRFEGRLEIRGALANLKLDYVALARQARLRIYSASNVNLRGKKNCTSPSSERAGLM